MKITHTALPVTLAPFLAPFLVLMLAACSGTEQSAAVSEDDTPRGQILDVTLSADQIAAAGIRTEMPTLGGAGTIELPATIEGDPQATQVVSAAIGGRVVSLTRNLGEAVTRGQTLAVIESREAAALKAEVEAARARLSLAQSNLLREQRLFAERVSPKQDLIAARTAATEAGIALRLARQQIAAAGGGSGAGGTGGSALNRIGIAAPLSGHVIARSVTLGQTVAADAELFRIADLSRVALSLNLQPADAGRIRPGARVTVKAAGREGEARIGFVSPALDAQTRLVPVIATLDNRAGLWRVGEPVSASIALGNGGGKGTGDNAVRVPTTAIQTVDGKPVVFVRTRAGFHAAPVTLGDTAEGGTIIRTGLNGRERIATTNSFTLKAELGKGEAGEED